MVGAHHESEIDAKIDGGFSITFPPKNKGERERERERDGQSMLIGLGSFLILYLDFSVLYSLRRSF